MRRLMSVLFLVIFCSEQMTSSAVISIDSAQSECCLEFTDVKIPVKRVVSYYRTSSSCPRPAIVFKTILGKEFCVELKTAWVSGHIDKVDKRTTAKANVTTATTTTATESNATKTSTESTAASTTAATAKTQSLTV